MINFLINEVQDFQIYPSIYYLFFIHDIYRITLMSKIILFSQFL